MSLSLGILLGFLLWVVLRVIVKGFYTVDQNERAVKTVFGRAVRLPGPGTPDKTDSLSPDEKKRYTYPQVKVIPPGGPYFKWPWEEVHKVSVATETLNMAFDPQNPQANQDGTVLEAVTKDQLEVGLTGQIRIRVAESNAYAYLFGVKNPLTHVMGYFVSVLRSKIANFDANTLAPQKPAEEAATDSVSINDLRRNLRQLNDLMVHECSSSAARYGIVLDASLITGINPPQEVESALAAINTAHNEVSSEISIARAAADQKIVQSRRAVEIETLRAEAEVEPLLRLADELATLRRSGSGTLDAYVRNVKLGLFDRAAQTILERKT